MVDMRLGYEFFSHIKKGTRLILIGDINQLPSVGPGNVFRELIQCGVIPVTVLDMVFRQKENSRIALNAYRMLKNDVALEYGADFVFIPVKSAAEAADTIEKLYLDAVTRLDTDQVQVLTPYRKKGDASVNALNERLWNLVNPPAVDKREIKSGSQVFRVGDKIIHNKNKNGISNGDTGFISDIYLDEDGVELARLDFSDGRSVEYTSDELEMVEHAYAITVHKSQGSEYPVIILPWIPIRCCGGTFYTRQSPGQKLRFSLLGINGPFTGQSITRKVISVIPCWVNGLSGNTTCFWRIGMKTIR